MRLHVSIIFGVCYIMKNRVKLFGRSLTNITQGNLSTLTMMKDELHPASTCYALDRLQYPWASII